MHLAALPLLLCDLRSVAAPITEPGQPCGGLPWEQEINDWRWCFSVNVFGVAQTVLTFLPRMLEAGTPAEIIANKNSLTGKYLSGYENIPVPATRRKAAARTRAPGA